MKIELDLNQCSESLRRAIALDDETPEEIIGLILKLENNPKLRKAVLRKKPRSSEFLSHFADETDEKVTLEVVKQENIPAHLIPKQKNVSIELLKKIATCRYEESMNKRAMETAIVRLAKEGYLAELVLAYFEMNDFSCTRYDDVGGVSSKGLILCLGIERSKIAAGSLTPEILKIIFKNLKSISIEESALHELEYSLITRPNLPLDIVEYYLNYEDEVIRCQTASFHSKRLPVEKVIELLKKVEFYGAYNNHYSWSLLDDTRLEPDFLRELYKEWNKRNLLT